MGFLVSTAVFAMDVTTSPYVQLKSRAELGLKTEAQMEALAYLNHHPDDGDVRTLSGALFFASHDYAAACQQLQHVLQQTPDYVDARLILANVYLASGEGEAALNTVNAGLILDPMNIDLMQKKADVFSEMTRISELTPISMPVRNLPRVVHRQYPAHVPQSASVKPYLNEVGIYQQQYYISDVKAVWDYTTLYYGRDTGRGKVFAKLNYANRLQKQALQGELEAYPRLNRYLYLDLDVAYANQPVLFPNQLYGAEAYFSFWPVVNFSGGVKYNYITSSHQYTLYTGTLSKALSNNVVTFRPLHFVPNSGKTSTLFLLDVRHLVFDPYTYVGCLIGAGTSPDLANLNTVDFIVLKNKIISPYINYSLLHEQLITNLSFLYQNQVFPGNVRIRNWTGGTVGLTWKF